MNIYLRDTRQFVGWVGLYEIDWSVPTGEIGVWANSRSAGQGLILEAFKALTAFAIDVLGINSCAQGRLACDREGLAFRRSR